LRSRIRLEIRPRLMFLSLGFLTSWFSVFNLDVVRKFEKAL
jgi:hypothetical protein